MAILAAERLSVAGVDACEVSVVIPCLNEAETIRECVELAADVLRTHEIAGEVIVVDNASTDGSGEAARASGAIVLEEPRRGYGNAYHAGFRAARGEYIIMADADLTYDFSEIPKFLAVLHAGADLVMGRRSVQPGAMPWLNRWIGNPLMSAILNILYRAGVRDVWCGMRGVRRSVLSRLDLRSSGMEFALEMVIRASSEDLVIKEVPIDLHPRRGTSKLSPLRDGGRGFRLMLMHSPTCLFLAPGGVLALMGVAISFVVLLNIDVFGRPWLLHTLIAGSLLILAGVQLMILGFCGGVYQALFTRRSTIYARLRQRVGLGHGLLLGVGLGSAGVAVQALILAHWARNHFGQLSEERLQVTAMLLMVLATEVFFGSLFVSLLGLREERGSVTRAGDGPGNQRA